MPCDYRGGRSRTHRRGRRGYRLLAVPDELIKRLRFEDAIQEEVDSWQGLVPPMPGWDQLEARRTAFARWLAGQLRAGLPATPHVIVSTRKASQGVRPVPIWGIAERVTYRALANFLLRNEPPLDRSPEAYLAFVGGPLQLARERGESDIGILSVGSSSIKYVVKADVAAFYEYVDHGLLGAELLALTGEYDAVQCLLSLLEEVQGRRHGLPQLLDPSDRLSEIYIDRVQRGVLRRGWPTWRFNDDFRIAVGSFDEALAAIEDLSAAAREAGLVLSDFKTTTPKFSTYAWETFGLQVDDELPAELADHEPEDFVADYTEGAGAEGNEWAIGVLNRVFLPDVAVASRPDDGIDLGNANSHEVRLLRRALSRLAKYPSAEILEQLIPLMAFVPTLSPWIFRLVVASHGASPEGCTTFVRSVMSDVALNDWQRAWALRTIDQLGMLGSSYPEQDAVAAWVRELLVGRHAPYVVGEGVLALAGAGRIEFSEVEHLLATEPLALAAWYLTAIRRLRGLGEVGDKEYRSAQGTDGVATALLHE